MKDSAQLSINDILKMPYFKNAVIAAGEKGLDKSVSWVHVLEQTQITDYVNGQELVLTTGAGWKNENDSILFLKQLIEQNVSALCIQLGARYNPYDRVEEMPSALLELANNNDFPLIVFPEEHECRFVDLIHDLHTLIINQSYRYLLDQENFLTELYHILLNPHDTLDILKYLNRTTDLNIAYYTLGENKLFVPWVSSDLQKKITELVEEMQRKSIPTLHNDDISIACQTASAGNQDLATLVIFSTKRLISDYELLILNKCAISLAHEHYGNLLGNEKDLYYQDKWIDQWLHGNLSNQTIQHNLRQTEPFIQPLGCTACLISFPPSAAIHKKETELMMYRISGVARSFLEQRDFSIHCFMEKHSIILIIVNKRDQPPWKDRLINALNQVNEVLTSSSFLNLDRKFYLSVGKMFSQLDQLNNSYENAKDTLCIQQKQGKPVLLFFDDLYVNRLIIALEKTGDLENYTMQYLRPILTDGVKAESPLLDTLIALRDCQYNKIEAAKKLFISRQSIYLRIKSLESMLGADFITNPNKRICIEIALYGLEYMNN
jgi:PucR family transcriptional regulator, purine catabolism regulatory protein